MQVRDATTADLPVLRQIYRAASLANEGDRELLAAHPEWLEFPDTSVREGRVRVATGTDGSVAGFVTTVLHERSVELEDLFVRPDGWRQGVGRRLVEDAVRAARLHGRSSLEVVANGAALGFYYAVGFTPGEPVALDAGEGYRLRMPLD